ncbi:hypothetical protein Tco_0184481 [Tanacetum coccineum]
MCQVSDLDHNKGKTSYEVESDVEPLILQTFGDLQAFYEDSKDDLKDTSDSLKTTGVNMKKLAASYADPRAAVEE